MKFITFLTALTTTVPVLSYSESIQGSNVGSIDADVDSLASDSSLVKKRRSLTDDAMWNQIGADIDGYAAGDESGSSVSLSSDGSIVAIGAHYNDRNGFWSGHVRIYEVSDDGTWIQKGDDILGEAGHDYSGVSVSLSSDGSIVAIGAHGNDEKGSTSGHVRVYKLSDGGTWTQKGADIDGEAAGDQSGYSISLSSEGSIVAIGAPFNDGSGTDAGHVRIYELSDDGTWTQKGSDINGEAAGDNSGESVSLSSDGSIVAIGAKYNNGKGHVRVYELSNSGIWTQKGADIDGEAEGDFSGGSVSLSSEGSIVAIGARFNDGSGTDAGHVRVYELSNSGTWTQKGSDIDGEAAADQSGGSVSSVSLSSDGSIVAIGAKHNDGKGSSSGHVRVYELSNSGTWTQKGADIDGEAEGDSSGGSVSLSSDGSIVAIGAQYNDENGSQSGHVRVHRFRKNTSSPSAAPTSSPSDAPTSSPSAAPTRDMFDWGISAKKDDVVVFSDKTMQQEVVLKYFLSNKVYNVTIFTKNCSAIVPSNVISYVTTNDTLGSKNNVTVWIDINQSSVENSVVWSTPEDDLFLIDFCVRLDLWYGDISMNFLEREVSLKVNMTSQNFTLSAENLDTTEGEEVNENVEAAYEVIACQCTIDGSCVSSQEDTSSLLSQGSSLYVCIRANTTDVIVDSVKELTIAQDGTLNAQVPIINGVNQGAVAVEKLANMQNEFLVRTQLISSFFEDDTNDLTVSGVAKLAFKSGRKLSAKIVVVRNLQAQDQDDLSSQFGLNVNIQSGSNEDDFFSGGNVVDFIFPIASVVIMGIVLPAISALVM